MGIAELGGAIIAQATQRVEGAAQNLTNMTTVGYKSRRQFSPLLDLTQGGIPDVKNAVHAAGPAVDFSAGKLMQTNNPFDLAISGNGFFVLRSGDQLMYTRGGQFQRDGDGRLTTPDGAVLQSLNGDVIVDSSDFTVLPDGIVQQAGQPVSQITLAAFDHKAGLKPVESGLFSALPGTVPRDAVATQIHQGMLEASNVSSAEEMTVLMAALRSAESGQRVIQVYDDLMGRALSTFGQT